MKNDKSGLFDFYWRVLGKYDLAIPVWEYPFAKGFGRNYCFDWAFPKQRIGVEVDGGVWLEHGGRHGGDGDREKLNFAAALGWRVFRFSPEMLTTEPEKWVAMVESTLRGTEDD